MTQTDTSGRLIGLELILLGDSYKVNYLNCVLSCCCLLSLIAELSDSH